MASENTYRAGVQHFLCHSKPLLLIQLQKCSGSLLKLTTGIVSGYIDASYSDRDDSRPSEKLTHRFGPSETDVCGSNNKCVFLDLLPTQWCYEAEEICLSRLVSDVFITRAAHVM